MGTCYSVAYNWYAWMVGSQVTSAGMLRYRNEPVDGETTIEFQHLVDADEELLELGHGNQPVTLITEDERRHLQSGRYDEIVVHNTQLNSEIDGKTHQQEEEIRLEEEAYYEAKREAARAARQAQALEATRAAAATAAAAHATHAAMSQHADVFMSRPLQPMENRASVDAVPARPAPTSAPPLRQTLQLDAESQLDAFARSAERPVASEASASSGGQRTAVSTPAQPASQTVSVERASSGQSTASDAGISSQSIPEHPVTSTQTDGANHTPATAVVSEPSRVAEQATQPSSEQPSTDVTSWMDEVDSSVRADESAGGGYSIMDDDDDDFDSFLESVKAKNFGPDAEAKAAETARRTSPPPLEKRRPR